MSSNTEKDDAQLESSPLLTSIHGTLVFCIYQRRKIINITHYNAATYKSNLPARYAKSIVANVMGVTNHF